MQELAISFGPVIYTKGPKISMTVTREHDSRHLECFMRRRFQKVLVSSLWRFFSSLGGFPPLVLVKAHGEGKVDSRGCGSKDPMGEAV